MKKLLAISVFALSLAFVLNAGLVLANEHKWEGHKGSYGPFSSGSPDSGTCGNNWANDTYNRVFTVDKNNTNTVVEKFKNGEFVTVDGASPGACDPKGVPNGHVGAGIEGDFGGDFVIVVTGGTFNPNAVCTQATCGTTASFISTVYGSSATYDIPSFFFHYETDHNGEWINASADRGGNHGDITGNLLPEEHDSQEN